MLKREKILVTGSSGMIGTAVCEYLLAKKYPVIGIDTTRNTWNPVIDDITYLGDLRFNDTYHCLPKGIEIVVHLASHARVYESVQFPQFAYESLQCTAQLLEYCRKQNINKFVLASSREIYKAKPAGATHEKVRMSSKSPYAASKIAAEAWLQTYHRCYGIAYMILRLSNVYGRYDLSDRVVPNYLRNLYLGKPLLIYGQDKYLDFTYIDDVVQGIFLAMKCIVATTHAVYNIASGQGSSLEKVARTLLQISKKQNVFIHQAARTGETDTFVADISKAKLELGYTPQFSLVEGLSLALKWYDAHQENLLSNSSTAT